ncbi:hypothetical protein [Streptomyces hokutonensis]|uniref:hypothetical protein n=1 Tax=Streptomyces hokutonensis TaxID=1306990 RepID=UPI003698A098
MPPLVVATAEAEKANANNSRTVMFTWNQRETCAAHLAAVTVAIPVPAPGQTVNGAVVPE